MAEPLTLTLENDTPGVTWPDWADALPDWDVVPQAVTDQTATLILRSWLPGDMVIPAVTATMPGGVTFTTEPRTVRVDSVLPDDADVADAGTLRDAAGAVALSDADHGSLRWWGVAAGLGAALVLAGLWIKRRLRKPIHPETLAAARLDSATQTNDVGEAVDAVRTYVETRFGHRLRNQTAAELAADTDAGAALGAALRDQLSNLQQRGDALRFAGGSEAGAPEVIALARRVFNDARAAAKGGAA